MSPSSSLGWLQQAHLELALGCFHVLSGLLPLLLSLHLLLRVCDLPILPLLFLGLALSLHTKHALVW